MIIGLSGKSGAGKTTLAQMIEREFGYTRVSFADGVKEEVKAFLLASNLDVEDKNLWGTQADRNMVIPGYNGKTYRELLQWWGTDYRRRFYGEDYWTQQLMKKMSDGGKYVIDDMRFPNEADACKQLGGFVVRIHRPDLVEPPGITHVSETALDDYLFDRYVLNNGPLGRLFDQGRFIIWGLQ